MQGFGSGNFSGVAGFGASNNGTGVFGLGGGSAGPGIRGIGAGGPNTAPGAAVGVYGQGGTGDAPGVLGQGGSAFADGVRGFSASGSAVSGESNNGVGVRAFSGSATGLVAEGDTSVPGTIGLIAAGNAFAGQFNGNVQVNGTLFKSAGGFKIDHPLEPNNKYLCHSFVESPEMLNVYSGTVTLDSNGEAPVVLPKWFEALNNDFRYQLTCVGAFAPVYVGEEIKGGTFKIAGGDPGMKVCWQVTGVRHDAYAQQNRLPVEIEKSKREQELRLGA